jgi:hypothetical protein
MKLLWALGTLKTGDVHLVHLSFKRPFEMNSTRQKQVSEADITDFPHFQNKKHERHNVD